MIHIGAAERVAVGSAVGRGGTGFVFVAHLFGSGDGGERRFVKRRVGLEAQQIGGQLFRLRLGHDFQPAAAANSLGRFSASGDGCAPILRTSKRNLNDGIVELGVTDFGA